MNSISLFEAWVETLRSPNIALKTKGCRSLAHLLHRAATSRDKSTLERYMTLLPLKRLEVVGAERLEKELEELPATTVYLKALVELSSMAKLAHETFDTTPHATPAPTPATALRLNGGASFVSLARADVTKSPWSAEFWVVRQGPSGGARLASSGQAALLLRTTSLSGSVGCVGFSNGKAEWAFPYEAPTGKLVHLAFVARSKPPGMRLFADGVLVGELHGATCALPLGALGDPQNSFRGLLCGARFWGVALGEADVAAAARGGPLGKGLLLQGADACLGDWDLQAEGGGVVRDRCGSGSSVVTGATWCEWGGEEGWSRHAGTALRKQAPKERVTVTGVWSRSGTDVNARGQVGKEAREPMSVAYWRSDTPSPPSPSEDGALSVLGGCLPRSLSEKEVEAMTEEEQEAVAISMATALAEQALTPTENEATLRIEGEITWFDSSVTASIQGSLHSVSGELKFRVLKIVEFGVRCEMSAEGSGVPLMQWVEGACFTGRVEGSKLVGTWEAVPSSLAGNCPTDALEPPAPTLPTHAVEFSSFRRSSNLEVTAKSFQMGNGGNAGKWGSVLLDHLAPPSPATDTPGGATDFVRTLDIMNHLSSQSTSECVAVRASTPGIAEGLVYFECTVKSQKAWCIGWVAVSEKEAAVDSGQDKKKEVATVRASIYLDASGKLEIFRGDGSSESYQGATPADRELCWEVGTVIGCLIDAATGVVRFSLDGHHLGVADAGTWLHGGGAAGVEGGVQAKKQPPALPKHRVGGGGEKIVVLPAANFPSETGATFNFGQTPFQFTPPVGYVSWQERVGGSATSLVAAPVTVGSSSPQTKLFSPWKAIGHWPLLWGGSTLRPPPPPLPSAQAGKYLWEFKVHSIQDSSTSEGDPQSSSGVFGNSSSADVCIGLCRHDSSLGQPGPAVLRVSGAHAPGHDKLSWGFLSSGEKFHNESTKSYGSKWKDGDMVGMELDFTAHQGGGGACIRFLLNNQYLGDAFTNVLAGVGGSSEKDGGPGGGGGGGGLIPCVALAARGVRVSLHKRGLKHGSAGTKFTDRDALGRRRHFGRWRRGCIFGEGVLYYSGSEKRQVRGMFIGDQLHGVAETETEETVPLAEQAGLAFHPQVFSSLGFHRTTRTSTTHELFDRGKLLRSATESEVEQAEARSRARKKKRDSETLTSPCVYPSVLQALDFLESTPHSAVTEAAEAAEEAELLECWWEKEGESGGVGGGTEGAAIIGDAATLPTATEESKDKDTTEAAPLVPSPNITAVASPSAATKTTEVAPRRVAPRRRRTGHLSASSEHLFTFSQRHRHSVTLSEDLLSCELKDGTERQLVYGSKGFHSGVHYWEVKVEKNQHGSMFVGVATACGSLEGESRERSSKGGDHGMATRTWSQALGFESYRATLCPALGETPYGKYYRGGDTVGVLLDLEKGELSFVREGFEASFFGGSGGGVTCVNMGPAFKHLRSHGSTHEKGTRVGNTTYFPVFGFSKGGDKISLREGKWLSSQGTAASDKLASLLKTVELCQSLDGGGGGAAAASAVAASSSSKPLQAQQPQQPLLETQPQLTELEMQLETQRRRDPGLFPSWFHEEAFSTWQSVSSNGRRLPFPTRAGVSVLVDSSNEAVRRCLLVKTVECAAGFAMDKRDRGGGGGGGDDAHADDGLALLLRSGSRVETEKGVCVVLGEACGKLWYRAVEGAAAAASGGAGASEVEERAGEKGEEGSSAGSGNEEEGDSEGGGGGGGGGTGGGLAWYWTQEEALKICQDLKKKAEALAAGIAPPPKPPSEWACGVCTFLNPNGAPECGICGSPNEGGGGDGTNPLQDEDGEFEEEDEEDDMMDEDEEEDEDDRYLVCENDEEDDGCPSLQRHRGAFGSQRSGGDHQTAPLPTSTPLPPDEGDDANKLAAAAIVAAVVAAAGGGGKKGGELTTTTKERERSQPAPLAPDPWLLLQGFSRRVSQHDATATINATVTASVAKASNTAATATTVAEDGDREQGGDDDSGGDDEKEDVDGEKEDVDDGAPQSTNTKFNQNPTTCEDFISTFFPSSSLSNSSDDDVQTAATTATASTAATGNAISENSSRSRRRFMWPSSSSFSSSSSPTSSSSFSSLDGLLVVLVNDVCDKLGLEPQHVTAHTLSKAFKGNLSEPAQAFKARFLTLLAHLPSSPSPSAASAGASPKSDDGDGTGSDGDSCMAAAVVARFAVLLALNTRLLALIPYVEMDAASRFTDAAHAVAVGGGGGGIIQVQQPQHHRPQPARKLSVLGDWVANHRHLIFKRTKLKLWREALKATETYVTPPLDEYETPGDVPKLKVDRIKANLATLAELEKGSAEQLQASVFGQVKQEMERFGGESDGFGGGGGAVWRRSWVDIQDAGQQRAFYVKFKGEGVDDHGGPYRAVFQSAVAEEPLVLGLLEPCPNEWDPTASNRDKLTLAAHASGAASSHAASFPWAQSSNSNSNSAGSGGGDGGSSSSSGGETGGSSGGASKVGPQLSDFSFLGKLVALAVRHSLLVPLNLSDLAWKPLVGLPVGRRELAGADKGKADALKMVEQWREEDFEEELESSLDGLMKTFGQVTVTTTSTSSGCGGCGGPTGGGGGGGSNNEEHIGGGGGVRSSSSSSSTQEPLTFLNRKAFVAEVEAKALTATNAQLSAFFHGLSAGLPCQLFPLFTPLEFEVLVCGAPDIDVELLKKVTEYQGEGVSSEAPHVKYLWESLERMDQSQRSKFVNFVSARSKLPSSADEFPMHFKVCEPKPSAKAEPDSHLPHSQTCFFTLSLPFYSSQEVCFRKLLYAIDNATTMDDDFQNREVWGDGTS